MKETFKAKTKSSIKKRFSLTSKNKVRFLGANRKHNMYKKSKCAIKNIKGDKFLSGAERKKVKNLLH